MWGVGQFVLIGLQAKGTCCRQPATALPQKHLHTSRPPPSSTGCRPTFVPAWRRCGHSYQRLRLLTMPWRTPSRTQTWWHHPRSRCREGGGRRQLGHVPCAHAKAGMPCGRHPTAAAVGLLAQHTAKGINFHRSCPMPSFPLYSARQPAPPASLATVSRAIHTQCNRKALTACFDTYGSTRSQCAAGGQSPPSPGQNRWARRRRWRPATAAATGGGSMSSACKLDGSLHAGQHVTSRTASHLSRQRLSTVAQQHARVPTPESGACPCSAVMVVANPSPGECSPQSSLPHPPRPAREIMEAMFPRRVCCALAP